MEQIQKAAFYIRDYYFERVTLDINNKPNGDEISVSFQTSGEFNKQNNSFNLRFRVDIGENFVSIICVGQFIFENANDITEIPDFFYVNSVALLFPYVRAYISLITTQANTRGVILPTFNLSGLGEELRRNTTEVE
jgi:preprotein translocase subunit SecB